MLGARLHDSVVPDPRDGTSRGAYAMSRILALLWLAGGALCLIGLLLPRAEGFDEAGFIGLAVAGFAVAALLLVVGARMPMIGFQAICALGFVLITLGNYWGSAKLTSVAENELIYLGQLMFAGYFFTRRAIAVQLLVLALSYGTLMLNVDAGDEALTRWAIVMVALTVATLFVSYLRELIVRELSMHRATLEATTDGILVVDASSHWQSYNQQFVEMWRIPPEIAEAGDDDAALAYVLDQVQDPAAFVAKVRELYRNPEAESYDELEFKDGRVFERYSKPQRVDGRTIGRVWSFRDVTERRRADERLKHLADHDPLTDLFNRRRFEEELGRELGRAARYDHGGALLLLDLDDFKRVNDTHGHLWGDEVLRATARLLRSRLRSSDVLARLGGDEFAVLLPEADAVRSVKLAEELLEVIRAHPFEIDDEELELTTSIGVVALDMLAPGSEPMVAADTAMYQAKRDGRDRLTVFDPAGDAQPTGPARSGGPDLRRGS